MTVNKNKGFINKTWKFLLSLRLTITLLILLSAVCVIGTLVPQNEPEEKYLRIYSKSTYNLLKATDCIDMYHAWWFILILGSFSVNLAACSLNRLPRIKKYISKSNPVLNEQSAEGLMCYETFSYKNHSIEKETGFKKALTEVLAKPENIRNAGQVNFFSEKGRYSHFGFYFIHSGLLVVIIGVLLGTLGFQGYMNIVEGEKNGTVTLRKTLQKKPLPFEIRCDKFEVTYYDKKQMPKDYKSTLTVFEEGRQVLTKIIEVNDPLIYKGIYFYQSNYGTAPGTKGTIHLGITNKDSGKSTDYDVKVGENFLIAGTKDKILVNNLITDFSMNKDGKIFSRSNEIRNPAVSLTVFPEGKAPYNTWVFAKFPDFHKTPEQPYKISFLNLQPVYYTGLQVTRDPGVWTVWLGCLLLTAGMCQAFFDSHRRLWLKIEEKEGGRHVVLAGTSNKNKKDFKDDFDKLYKKIKSIGKTKC